MTQSPPPISIVIPFYNEFGNVEHLVEEVVATVENKYPYEIILVDDGSSDQTYAEILHTLEKFPHLVAIRHRKNLGQSAALRSGIEAAKNPWIVTLDGDGQNNPADICLLISRITQMDPPRKVVVFGNRNERRDKWSKKISSFLANTIRRSILQDRCLDTGCALKLFPRDDFLKLPLFNHFHRFLPALFQYHGHEVINVPVSHRARIRGVSKYNFWNRVFAGALDLAGVLWLKYRAMKPPLATTHYSSSDQGKRVA